MADATAFAQHAEGVARLLLGDPNRKLSSKDELRFGSNGSLVVDIRDGKVFDHEAKTGGGLLWLIERQTKCKGREAVEWMNEHGFTIASDELPALPHTNGHANGAAKKPRWGFLPGIPDEAQLVSTFDYTDQNGALHYQVCRFEWPAPGKPKGYDKSFRQRRPDPSKSSGWAWNIKGVVTPLPYQLPDLIEAVASDATIFIAEGEKTCDALRALGVPATCNSGGAGKWDPALNPWFKGANVVILPDNDEPGRHHRDLIASQLKGVARAIKVLTLPGLPEKGDAADWAAAGGTADDLYELAQGAAPAEGTGLATRLGLVLWQDLGKPKEPHEWLCKKWVTSGEVAVIAGPSQSGKTFAVFDLAMCIARGLPWLGKYRCKQGLVVYQAGEGAKGLLSKRIPAYRQEHGLRWEDNVPLAVIGRPINLAHGDDDCDAIIADTKAAEAATRIPAAAIVIDTVSAATPGTDENASKDMGPVLARCARIAQETGAAVLLVAHMNADGGKVRGWTGITANVDSVINVALVPDHRDGRNRQLRELTLTKAKDGENGIRERFVLKVHEIGRDRDDDPITSCTIEPPAGGSADDPQPAPGAPAAPRLSDQQFIYLTCIREALREHGGAPPPELGIALPVVHKDWVADLFSKRWQGDESDPKRRGDAIRQARKKNGEKLVARGLIGSADPYLWITPKGGGHAGGHGPVTPDHDGQGSVTPDEIPG